MLSCVATEVYDIKNTVLRKIQVASIQKGHFHRIHRMEKPFRPTEGPTTPWSFYFLPYMTYHTH